jgi:hypothetical protein
MTDEEKARYNKALDAAVAQAKRQRLTIWWMRWDGQRLEWLGRSKTHPAQETIDLVADPAEQNLVRLKNVEEGIARQAEADQAKKERRKGRGLLQQDLGL